MLLKSPLRGQPGIDFRVVIVRSLITIDDSQSSNLKSPSSLLELTVIQLMVALTLVKKTGILFRWLVIDQIGPTSSVQWTPPPLRPEGVPLMEVPM